MKRFLIVSLLLAGSLTAQPRTPLTRALADALYCPLASCATASSTTTFTNKSIALGTNTITGTTAQFNTALTDNDFATLGGIEAFTNKSISLTSNTLTATSLELKTAISDETGAGALVFQTSPTISAPVIADFTSAGHDHADADDGGQIAGAAALSEGTTGTGAFARATSPTFETPLLGTPTSGVATNLTGTASGLTAGTVTTNANLTGPITSVGNATSVGAQTGTGSTFAMQTAPQLTSVNITDVSLSLNGAQWQTFAFHITNTAGTIQHAFFSDVAAATALTYAGKINGASSTLANTPSVNGATAFVSGAGIDAGTTSRVLFDTGAQTSVKFGAHCSIESNSTATAALYVLPRTASTDVNGTTLRRFALSFSTTAGAAFALTTVNIGAGAAIQVRCIALLE